MRYILRSPGKCFVDYQLCLVKRDIFEFFISLSQLNREPFLVQWMFFQGHLRFRFKSLRHLGL